MNDEAPNLDDWVGKQEVMEALVTSYNADAMAATLDRDDAPLQAGDPIPPGWHQLFIREVVKLSDTAADGHPKRGGFLPPIALPRRMWAGTKSIFHRSVRIGETVRKTSTIQSVTPKTGKTGQLVFLNLKHEIESGGALAVTEIQDVVYREQAKPGTAPPEPPPAPGEAV